MRKKIGIVIWNSEYKVGGVERVCFYLTNILKALYDIEIIDRKVIPECVLKVLSPFLNKFSEITTTLLLDNKIKRNLKKFDLIITNGFNGAFLKNIKVPKINIYHGFMAGYRRALEGYISYKRKQYLKLIEYMEKLSGINSINIAVSNDCKEGIEKYYKVKIYEVIPNGVDINFFYPYEREMKISLRKKYNIPNKRPVVIFSGRLEIGKGVDILEKIIPMKKNLYFLLLTNKNSKYYRYFKNLENVRIFPEVSYEKLPEFYNCSDIFFLPSRFEGCELSTLEAISCGLIPVGFNVGNMKLLKRELKESFILNVNTDIEKIGNALENAAKKISDKIYIKTLREFAEKKASLDIFKEKWIGLISKII